MHTSAHYALHFFKQKQNLLRATKLLSSTRGLLSYFRDASIKCLQLHHHNLEVAAIRTCGAEWENRQFSGCCTAAAAVGRFVGALLVDPLAGERAKCLIDAQVVACGSSHKPKKGLAVW